MACPRHPCYPPGIYCVSTPSTPTPPGIYGLSTPSTPYPSPALPCFESCAVCAFSRSRLRRCCRGARQPKPPCVHRERLCATPNQSYMCQPIPPPPHRHTHTELPSRPPCQRGPPTRTQPPPPPLRLCPLVQVEYASEFRYRTPILFAEDVVIAISQSGETADTLAALQLARAAGCLCLGICNTVGSSIARETHAGIYLHAGPEIGVASTKAFSAQVPGADWPYGGRMGTRAPDRASAQEGEPAWRGMSGPGDGSTPHRCQAGPRTRWRGLALPPCTISAVARRCSHPSPFWPSYLCQLLTLAMRARLSGHTHTHDSLPPPRSAAARLVDVGAQAG